MLHRSLFRGLVALMFLLGTLVLAAPAHAAETCDTTVAGTQAYAECVARGGDLTGGVVDNEAPAPRTPVVEESATEVWQLGLAGVIGAVIAIGAALGMSRLGQRQHAPAH